MLGSRFGKNGILALALALVIALGGGIAYANEVNLLGLGESHSYSIQIYAQTDYYTADVTRAISSRGTIKANITSTKPVYVRVSTGAGSVLTDSYYFYKGGSKKIFTNTYGGSVKARPEARAATKAHLMKGTWTYKDQ